LSPGDWLLAHAFQRYLHSSFRRLALPHDPASTRGARNCARGVVKRRIRTTTGEASGFKGSDRHEGKNRMDLNTLLFLLVGVLVVGYAVLDGFDLGVGIVSLFARSKEERDLHVASIGPVWDGNEVWLLATGNVLFGAFPLVFTTVLSGFYLAFILLLVALVARAVAIEFRLLHPSPLWGRFWDGAFALGSLASAFLLGVAVGNVLRGVPVGPGFVWKGSFVGLLNPYGLLIGIVSCILLLMHGAIYLWMKT